MKFGGRDPGRRRELASGRGVGTVRKFYCSTDVCNFIGKTRKFFDKSSDVRPGPGGSTQGMSFAAFAPAE